MVLGQTILGDIYEVLPPAKVVPVNFAPSRQQLLKVSLDVHHRGVNVLSVHVKTFSLLKIGLQYFT